MFLFNFNLIFKFVTTIKIRLFEGKEKSFLQDTKLLSKHMHELNFNTMRLRCMLSSTIINFNLYFVWTRLYSMKYDT